MCSRGCVCEPFFPCEGFYQQGMLNLCHRCLCTEMSIWFLSLTLYCCISFDLYMLSQPYLHGRNIINGAVCFCNVFLNMISRQIIESFCICVYQDTRAILFFIVSSGFDTRSNTLFVCLFCFKNEFSIMYFLLLCGTV